MWRVDLNYNGLYLQGAPSPWRWRLSSALPSRALVLTPSCIALRLARNFTAVLVAVCSGCPETHAPASQPPPPLGRGLERRHCQESVEVVPPAHAPWPIPLQRPVPCARAVPRAAGLTIVMMVVMMMVVINRPMRQPSRLQEDQVSPSF